MIDSRQQPQQIGFDCSSIGTCRCETDAQFSHSMHVRVRASTPAQYLPGRDSERRSYAHARPSRYAHAQALCRARSAQ